ncbi:conjugal transfer protein TraG N-terminal domain-containing protein, partial [Comamonas aquatica]|uniref:conjugal transfer protein TraG N-terminal domain-containing protein n=1 Tax=Comamonas aquatica TaxID=225991 RepID=UPI0028D03C47
MQLDSYLEIFTTLYGWAFANLIGGILSNTGIAAVPFALILVNTWREAKEKGQGQNVMSLLEASMTKIWVAIFVMCMCFATTSYTSLSRISLNYTPAPTFDDPNPQTVDKQTQGAVLTVPFGTDAVKAFGDSGDISYVPVWWLAVMSVSNGINSAFRAGLSNADNDFRRLEDIARTSTIEDPKLLKSIQDFYSQCYTPARSKFLGSDNASLSASGRSIISPDNSDYGPTDTDWIGSQLFRTEPGYYAEMRSYNPVPGWAIDFSRDVEYIQSPPAEGTLESAYVNPDWGRPTCKQWWEDEAQGIRSAMVNHSSSWRVMAQQALSMASSPDKAKDSVAKLAQTQARPMYVSPDTILGAQHDAGTVA